MADQRSDEPSSSARPAAAAQDEGRAGAKTPDTAARKRLRSLQTFQFDGSRETRDPGRDMSMRSPEPSDSKTQRRRPPASLRRASSKHLPYRGQEFSVDDAAQEVDADQSTRQAVSSGSLKRVPSTLRRRGTAPQSRLPHIDSRDEDAEDSSPVAPRSLAASGVLSRTATNNTAPSVTGEDEEYERVESDNGDDAAAAAAAGENDDDDDDAADGNDDDDGDLSDAESFTLRDRQEAINETHPFGIRIWKPALYKKGRSVEKDAEGDIHSTPGGHVNGWLWFFNLAWTLIFGWWLALVAAAGGVLCHLLALIPGCTDYGVVLFGLAGYLFYPFGKYVKLISDEAYFEEDEGEGRSISEYERWQTGDLEEGRLFFGPNRSIIGRRRSDEDSEEDETTSLLGRQGRSDSNGRRTTKRRLFGRGDWNFGRVIFFLLFYILLAPLLSIVSLLCWLFVFTIPMGRVTFILLDHLRRHPLALEFHHDSAYSRPPSEHTSSILVCTYRAVGTKYWKYTVDGTNIFLINLLAVVAFVIFDYFVVLEAMGIKAWFTDNIFIFMMALFSIIPLAYFIGQAVASISAQSTMGVGAVINAFFSTLVEVFLYCVALSDGKARLVEGSIIGSIFAGILFLPGISMCFGAIKRKTQRFNVKSAGVTTTMLLFAVIGAFGPTLFYQIFGSHEMNCMQCEDDDGQPLDRDCRQCYFAQIPAINDPFYINAVRPFTMFASLTLFLAYIIGLLFTLRTHAATIWNTELDEKKEIKTEATQPSTTNASVTPVAPRFPGTEYGTLAATAKADGNAAPLKSDIKDSLLYKRILNQSLKQAGLASPTLKAKERQQPGAETDLAKHHSLIDAQLIKLPLGLNLSAEDSEALVRQMIEVSATAAALTARDASAVTIPRRPSVMPKATATADQVVAKPVHGEGEGHIPHGDASGGGHDAPNWSRNKSCAILLIATVAYAIVAEILVDTVDAVLENVDIDEKFLGITLFALVPNTTEFLNAISFAMNGNIALSMEIGSAYALQVCLLQIPALVLFSVFNTRIVDPADVIDHTFVLLFPQWDMVTVILCVFLLSYMYGEGKSNYFKGSILILAYLVVVVGFYLSDFSNGFVVDPNKPFNRPDPRGSRFRVMGSLKPSREL